MERNPYQIIKRRYVTEKAMMLEGLQNAESNPCIKKFQNPKVVFLVDPKATKKEITWALQQIYAAQKIKIVSVNTVRMKPKTKRMRGRLGRTNLLKKAIVTLEAGDMIEDNV